MKNGSWNKFFLCFRPMDMEVSDDVDCYISVNKMDSDSFSGRKSSSRRSFSGAVKSILSEKSLSKRFRRRSLREEIEDYADELAVITTERETQFDFPGPESTLSPSSSSLESDCDGNHQMEEVKTECENLRRFSLDDIMYLLVVSLWGNVLWGKLIAVMMTIVWIYLVGFCFKNRGNGEH